MSYDQQNPDVARTPSSSPETAAIAKPESTLYEIAKFACIALVIVLPVRWFVAQPFIVSGASMEETFHNNEYLIVDQLSYYFEDPARGEVIVFRYPNDPSKYFIKRVIGLPGETLHLSGTSITVINDEHPDGMTLHEPYAALGNGSREETVTLGPTEYFVMGDNRDHSSDSRAWGNLERDLIVGRAFVRLLPPDRIGLFPGAATAASD